MSGTLYLVGTPIGNLGDISGMIASAMKIVDGAKAQLPPKA